MAVSDGQVMSSCQVANDMLDSNYMFLSKVVGELAQLGDHVDYVRSRHMHEVGEHPDGFAIGEVSGQFIGVIDMTMGVDVGLQFCMLKLMRMLSIFPHCCM